jgi:hypothetical protein
VFPNHSSYMLQSFWFFFIKLRYIFLYRPSNTMGTFPDVLNYFNQSFLKHNRFMWTQRSVRRFIAWQLSRWMDQKGTSLHVIVGPTKAKHYGPPHWAFRRNAANPPHWCLPSKAPHPALGSLVLGTHQHLFLHRPSKHVP